MEPRRGLYTLQTHLSTMPFNGLWECLVWGRYAACRRGSSKEGQHSAPPWFCLFLSWLPTGLADFNRRCPC